MRKLLALTVVLLLLVGVVVGPAAFAGEPAKEVRTERVETHAGFGGNDGDVSINSPIAIGGS